MTPEEIEALKAKAAEAETLKAQMVDKDKEIEGLRNKDQSFSEVRDMLKKSEEEKKGMADRIVILEQDKVENPKRQMLDVLAGSDAELRKQLEDKFAAIAPNAKTQEEIESGMKDAFMLVTKRPAEDVIRHNQSGAGGMRATVKSTAGNVDPNVQNFANEFNKHMVNPGMKITEDDLKKRAQ